MEQFLINMAGVAWNFIPILLIFFLMSGIMVVFYFRIKFDELLGYIRSIAISMERLSSQQNDYEK